MNISILSPLIKLKIHSQHIHKFFMHVIKGFVMKFARPRDSTKLCYIHDITTGIFMLKLNKFHHTGISILVFFTMHTFICSNFQINLCKSIQQDINHFRSNQSNLSNIHSIILILSLAASIWGWQMDQAMPECTIKPKSVLMYQSIPQLHLRATSLIYHWLNLLFPK